MKKIIIIINIFLIITAIEMFSSCNIVYGSETADSLWQKAGEFISRGKGKGEALMPDDKIKNIVSPVSNVLISIATVVVVCTTLIMGIKYVVSGPEQQAALKKQLIGLVVSIVVIYGAYGIWLLSYQIMSSL